MSAARQSLWSTFLVLAACGSNPNPSANEATSDAGTGATTGGSMQDDAGATTGGSMMESDGGSSGAMSDAGSPFLTPDSVLVEPTAIPARTAKLLDGVSGDPVACPDGAMACNGACLSTVGETSAGCTALAITSKPEGGIPATQFNSMLLDGDVVFMGDNAGKLYRIPLDGSGVAEVGKVDVDSFRTTRPLARYQDKLIVAMETPSGFKDELALMDPTTGARTPIFPGLMRVGKVALVGNTFFYTQETTYQDFAIYRRELPDGAPVKLFEVEGLRGYWPDAEQILITRDEVDFEVTPTVMVAPADGKGPTLGLSSTNSSTFVFRTAGRAYWLGSSEGFLLYEYVDFGADQIETPIALPNDLGGVIAHDDEFVYFKDGYSNTATDRIYRMPINGGDLVPVATFKDGELQALAVHGHQLIAGLGYAATTGVLVIDLP